MEVKKTVLKTVSPADGPVAVTGASGYIGSWLVQDLLEQGYQVRACVRDPNKAEKVDHLLAMNNAVLRGRVELHAADLFQRGSYDEVFKGCCAVISTGAAVGFNQETPQQVYDGCFTEVEHLVESVKKSGTVKRFVFTSSFAAVSHPCVDGYVFTEKDWCDDKVEGQEFILKEEMIPKDRDTAYALAKVRAERMIYQMAEEGGGFDAISIMPVHVLGPAMCANHDQPWSWQNCVRFMMKGKDHKMREGGRMLWNIVDVRDVARAHRLCIESPNAGNGSRYILGATDRSGELFTWQLQNRLKELYPGVQDVGGEEMKDGQLAQKSADRSRTYCMLAQQELGLSTYSVNETLRDTVDSYYQLGLL